MKVLLTGATGLIGKEVGKVLTTLGYHVISLTRDAEKAQKELPFLTEVIEWKDFSQSFTSEDLKKLEGLGAVVNLMGENLSAHRWNDTFKKKLVASRVEATRALIRNLSTQALPKIWVQGSAVGYYGESKAGTVFDESSSKGQGFLSDLCEAWEETLHDLPTSVRTIVMRTGVVFSHQGGAFPQMLDPLMKGIGGVIGNGEQRMSIIHLVDMARFVAEVLKPESTASGVYNLVARDPISQKDLTHELCSKLFIKPGPRLPAFSLKLLLGEMSEMVLQSQGVKSTRLNTLPFELEFQSAEQILNEITAWYKHPVQKGKSVFIVYAEQFLPTTREAIFPFFADAKNLEKLTPEFLHFNIKRISGLPMQEGTKILYNLKLHGVPFKWLTLIARWEPPFSFADRQMKGPYALWYHEHLFKEAQGGTLMQDWVRYELPLGKAGKLFGLSKVREDVEKIFRYRREAVAKVFTGN